MERVTSLIRGKWQPVCFAGNLKSIRYKRALISALVRLKKNVIFSFFVSSRFCKTTHQKFVSFSFKVISLVI